MNPPWSFGPSPDQIQKSIEDQINSIGAQNKAFHDRLQAEIQAQQQSLDGGGHAWNPGFGNAGAQDGGGHAWDTGFGNAGAQSGQNWGIGDLGSSHGPQSAISSISVGPDGGFQAGQISPESPGIESRFAEEIAPPSGGNIAVFSSSSSSHSVGPDGKETSHKQSTTGVNDNGKVTIKTVHDP